MARFKTIKTSDHYMCDTRKILIFKCCDCGSMHYINVKVINKNFIRMIFHKKRKPAAEEANKEQQLEIEKKRAKLLEKAKDG
jgi:hypothetical protein